MGKWYAIRDFPAGTPLGEPRTNGLRVQCKPFIYAGFRVYVHQDVATAEKFVFFGVLCSNDAGFEEIVGLILPTLL
jgi:hypothetical protein